MTKVMTKTICQKICKEWRKMKKENKQKRIVVITGASSGIGLETAKYFAQNGDIVYGLARRKIENDGIKSIICDITKTENIKIAINTIFEKEKRIDILVNNAGFGISGSVENQKTEDIKSIFEVNFFGAVKITQEVLPIMRKQGYGKIFNTGSVAGVIPIPFQSFYSATKASIDIWGKALALEVMSYGVHVCTMLVGDTKTGFTAERQKSNANAEGDYSKVVKKSIGKMEHDEQNGKPPITVAKAIYKLSLKRKIPATKAVGFSYKFICCLQKILPQKFMMWVVKKMYC